MPNFRSRVDMRAELQFLQIATEIASRGGFAPRGSLSRPVIVSVLEDYPDWVREESENFHGMKVSDDFLKQELRENAQHGPQRWNDTSPSLKDKMMILSRLGDQDCIKALSLWIGEDRKAEALRSRRSLAALVLKNIHDRLRRTFPENHISFWWNLERTEDDPQGLHLHGVVIVDDPALLAGSNLRRLNRAIRHGAGIKEKDEQARALKYSRRAVIDLGWYRYCRKQRRMRTSRPLKLRAPSVDYGRLQSTSHQATATSREFYERLRRVVRGIQTGKMKDWTNSDWDLVQPH